MAYQIIFFGWCSEEGHDKVWGFVTVGENQLYNFWGKRGKRFSFKKHTLSREPEWRRKWRTNGVWEAPELRGLRDLAEKKCEPGRKNGTYVEVPVDKIEEVVPDFFNEFEKQLTLAKLFDNFRNSPKDE